MEKLRGFFSPELKAEIISVVKVSIPIIITNLLQFTILTESVIMCGHLSASALEAVGLANSMVNAFGLGINVGIITACDTLFSQCFGSKDKKRAGMFLQRGIMICSIHPLVLGILYFYIEPIFIALGQNTAVSQKAAFFMQISIPAVFFHSEYYVLLRYMQSQHNVYPPIFIAFFGNLFNVVSQYILIFQLGFDYEASAICQAAAYAIEFVLALLYVVLSKFYEPTWDGWKAESLFDWTGFAGLAIAGVGHLCLEIICYEGCTFLSGVMGVVELGAQSILFQTETVIYMIPIGIGIAVNIRTGQSLGGNNPDAAKLALKAGISIAAVSAIVLCTLLLSLRNIIPTFFTTDTKVLEVAINAFPVIAFVVVMNHAIAILNGMLRGCGRQKIGACIVLFAYDVIAFPIAIIMTFFSNFGILGLWLGIAIGLTVGLSLLTTVSCKQNFEEQAEKAQERIRSQYEVEAETAPLLDSVSGNHENPRENFRHSRTLSEPYGCSIDIPVLPPAKTSISREDFIRVATQKTLLMLAVVLCFTLALILHIIFPFHFTDFPTNNSTDLNTTVSILTTTLSTNDLDI